MLISLSLTILLLPLLAFVFMIFFGKRLPRQGDWLSTTMILAALGLSVAVLIAQIAAPAGQTASASMTWLVIGTQAITLGITIDNIAAIMLVVVTLISSLVHLFSIGYMKDDPRYSRYFAYLGLFSFSMLGIVLTSNILMMYMFWELVGISSYLLIGFWYEKKSASNAANKAFIVNRVGDFGMFLGIMILFFSYASFSFESIFASIDAGMLPFQSEGWLTAAGVLIFCGAVGKSAQFPLQVWLPDAMEGPTPVSALIHAATMVAAGVYLVARVFPLLTADALLIIAYIGAVTALIAATIAVTQYDIKKVLAYSTISQLGYMVLALGVGAYTAGFMHLVTHAAFKAGLFLGSGSVIFAMHHALHKLHDHSTDAQDVRNMGGLKSKMPVTYWTFFIFTLAIAGVPLTSGFLSKDEILAGTLAFSTLEGHWLLPLIAFFVAGLTAFYMFRVLILTFHGKPANPKILDGIKESPWLMTLPLIILAALSLFVFYTFNPIGASSGWFYQSVVRPESVVPFAIAPAAWPVFYEAIHSVHTLVMVLSVLIAGAGIVLALAVYQWKKISADDLARRAGMLYRGASAKWYFDELYDVVFVKGTHVLMRFLSWFDTTIVDGIVNAFATVTSFLARISSWIDENIIDGIVTQTASTADRAGGLLSKVQTGKVQTYLALIVFSFIILFLITQNL
ncbi:MAG: NADH-quinone oxidoreductase subunit L [Bacteroidetes bacterium HLUCCA01]|nr:MAG: NADH-quinone oxidoreductase subunit L [Bacteroidetes bacterium HLUCCA01]